MAHKQLLVSLFISAFSISGLAQAQDDSDDEFNYSVGLFVSGEKSLYVGGDDDVEVLPWFSAEWGRFFIEGPSLGVHLYEKNNWSVSTSIEAEGLGEDDRDGSAQLADMEKIDSSVNGVFSVGYENDWGELELSLAADLSSAHDGYTAELSYGYPFEVDRWMIEPQVSIEWFSKDVSQYYYGVSTLSARPGRAFYRPDSGTNYSVGVSATYPFLERHAVVFTADYTSYSSEITDSPIVDQDSTSEIGVGYVYRF